MKKFAVTILGTTPLLQNAFTAKIGKSIGTTTKPPVKATLPDEIAEEAAYWDKDDLIVHPTQALMTAMRDGGAYESLGGRKTAKAPMAAAIFVEGGDFLPLLLPNGERTDDFIVDSRRIVNPHTGGAGMCHRPRFEQWMLKFTLRVYEDILSVEVVRNSLVNAGRRIGIGDYRPQKGGRFGMFDVIQFDEIP